MSVNKVNKTTGELVTLANGTRMWVGTKTAHDLAVQQGTMPNNCMVCITDDYDDKLRNVTYQIISDTALTTTATNYTTYSGRKLSDYDYFIVQQYDSSSLRNSAVINLNQFKLKRVILSTLHGANSSSTSDYSVSGINVSYVDDTTVNAYATGSAMINILKIMGVKITH